MGFKVGILLFFIAPQNKTLKKYIRNDFFCEFVDLVF